MVAPSNTLRTVPLALWRAGAWVMPRPLAARTPRDLLATPFDVLRQQHAGAVRAGWLPRSLLSSARVERTIDAFEKLVLGRLARQR